MHSNWSCLNTLPFSVCRQKYLCEGKFLQVLKTYCPDTSASSDLDRNAILLLGLRSLWYSESRLSFFEEVSKYQSSRHLKKNIIICRQKMCSWKARLVQDQVGSIWRSWLQYHCNRLTHCGRVTHYGDGSMLCKNPIFFIMKELPQI